jgi:hypothetical protein
MSDGWDYSTDGWWLRLFNRWVMRLFHDEWRTIQLMIDETMP